MHKLIAFAAVALMFAPPAMAQQVVPGAKATGGGPATVGAISPIVAPAGGGAGIGRPVAEDNGLPVVCLSGCSGGGGGSLSATASASPTPVTAGANKPLNIGLFSNLFATLVDASGNPIDFTATSPVQLQAGTALAGKFGIDQTSPGVTDSVSLKASETHLGEVGGNQIHVQVSPATTAVAFTSGWSIGGLQTIVNASRVSGGTGLLQDVQVYWKSTQTSAQAAMDIFLFSDNGLSSACTNAAAFVLSSADWTKLVGVIHVTDTTAGNTTTVGQTLNLAKGYWTVATSLYGCAVTRGTPTLGTLSDVTFNYNFIRN